MWQHERSHERFRVPIPALFAVTGTGRVLVLKTRDVSRGGALLCTRNPVAVGSEGRVELLLARAESSDEESVGCSCVRIPATVIRNQAGGGMAVRFVGPPEIGRTGNPQRRPPQGRAHSRPAALDSRNPSDEEA